MKPRLTPSTRHGFSLIELLVVVGIIGILAGLALPAVQASREAARRARCANNLGQLIRATHSFEAARGGFPPASSWGRPLTPGDNTVGSFSVQCRLLPFLEQGPLYNAINFELPSASFLYLDRFHRTAATRVIDTFLCPSDPSPGSSPFAANSYRACTGTGEMRKLAAQTFDIINDGAFAHVDDGRSQVLPVSSFRDGLSHTLAFSEKPIGSGAGGAYQPFRDWVDRNGGGELLTADSWMAACSQISPDHAPQLDGGRTWMRPGAIHTHFFTSAPPNTRVPDCGTAGLNHGFGIFASRSYHPGGVNAAMADGSVRWFTSGTQVKTWRSLGTRAGGEVVSE